MPRVSRSYHHGDLRAALLGAALEILRTEGSAALTLREVARRAGVSHQAPYHHFADRAALVAAVAQDGFERLMEAVERARSSADDPVAEFREGGLAYVIFAVRHPEHYRIMFGPELADRSAHPDLDRAARRVFEALSAPPGGGARPPEASGPSALQATLWSMVHGLAMLLIDGQLRGKLGKGGTVSAAAARRIALEVTEVLWFGLRESLFAMRSSPSP
jgi:AcrR family transcriptional regulator